MNPFYESRDVSLFTGEMIDTPYPLHVHEIVELVCLRSGGCTMQINRRIYRLGAGDIAVMFPFVPHSFERLEPGTRGLSAFLLPGTIPEYHRLFSEATPAVPILKTDAVPEEAKEAVHRLEQLPGDQQSPFRLPYLHLLLAYLLQALEYQLLDHRTENNLIIRVVQYIHAHAFEPLSLRNVADALGISPSYLSHLLSIQLKTNLRRLINSIRINHALTLMRDPGRTLTEISFECGYENIRTFRRAFVSETGVLPTSYLKQKQDRYTAEAGSEAVNVPTG